MIKTICGELRSLSGSVNWNIEKECISVLPQVISYEFPISMSLAELIELFDSREDILDDDILKKRFKDASGGEKQKTIILTRVNTKTKFLILDEPFNHLDKKSSKDIMNFIIQLINQKVIDGVILISHIDVDFSTSRVKELNLS